MRVVHLGQNTIVPEELVVGVFDLDNASSARLTREFLTRAEQDGRVINISDALPKSFVITKQKNSPFSRRNEGRDYVYLSPLGAGTISKRGGEYY
jgi:hypothetical protein